VTKQIPAVGRQDSKKSKQISPTTTFILTMS
jgi:hypothetical protein